jgi:hypothetical protein
VINHRLMIDHNAMNHRPVDHVMNHDAMNHDGTPPWSHVVMHRHVDVVGLGRSRARHGGARHHTQRGAGQTVSEPATARLSMRRYQRQAGDR